MSITYCKKTEKLNPKISAPAVAIRSAIAAAMSKSNREIRTIIWKKDRLDKSIGLVTGNQINVPSKTAPRCPSYKGNSEIFS
jgi:hypothetical protein